MSGHDVDVAILGAGTAGMAAYREVVKRTGRVALIDGGPLGTTCARVGCMPSKLLIAAADAAHEARHATRFGVSAGPVAVDGAAVMARVRRERDRFAGFVREAAEGFEPGHLVRSHARFLDDTTLELENGGKLTARSVIIATGSRPVVPPELAVAGDRLAINDDVFDWQDLPCSAAVFGAGVIGLELGQALSRLGVRVHLFGRGSSVGPLSDPDLVAYARATFASEFPAHFDAETEVSRDGDAVVVRWRDRANPETGGEERFDVLLAATGRRPNSTGSASRTPRWCSTNAARRVMTASPCAPRAPAGRRRSSLPGMRRSSFRFSTRPPTRDGSRERTRRARAGPIAGPGAPGSGSSSPIRRSRSPGGGIAR